MLSSQRAAIVSHEIDNPVGIILVNAELLLEELKPDDPLRDDFAAIIEECRRCIRITGGLLGFSRSPEWRLDRIELNQLVEETTASLRPQKLFKDLDLRIKSCSEDLCVTGDAISCDRSWSISC